jgi:hypothetical protein
MERFGIAQVFAVHGVMGRLEASTGAEHWDGAWRIRASR